MRKPFLLFVLFSVLAACGMNACGSAKPEGPNLLLVTFDTTRADHLSCYGYQKNTSPHLDALAQDGLRFDNAYAVTSWTLPAHASLFTGKFPSAHGAHYNPDGKINLVMEGGIKGNPLWDQYRANTIAKTEITLAQMLTDHGYATKGIIGGPWMKKVFGLDKGFEDYDDSNFQMQSGTELNGRTAEDITNAAIRFVDENLDQPFFLFLNYYDPHTPYTPQSYLSEFWSGPYPQSQTEVTPEWNLALYDAEIKYTDAHFGRLIEHLKTTGLYEDTWILMTADHGELMGEPDGQGRPMQGHGDSLSEPEIHIPFLVKEAGADRRRGVETIPVQQVDVMPTLLDMLGLRHPPGMQGNSIYEERDGIVAEVYPLPMMNAASKPWRQLGDWKTIRDGRWKFVWGGNGRHLLFDLEADPDELRNLIDVHPNRASELEAKLLAYFEALPSPGEAMDVNTSLEDLETLKNAGYIGGDDGH